MKISSPHNECTLVSLPTSVKNDATVMQVINVCGGVLCVCVCSRECILCIFVLSIIVCKRYSIYKLVNLYNFMIYVKLTLNLYL